MERPFAAPLDDFVTMQDYEKLGVFYLGRTFDPTAQRATAEKVLLNTRDLTTHAVCVGMTGSGKTGLGVALLEEAAIDGIPAIAIDPKGDLGNLLLTFPQLRPADFEPWIDPGEATQKGTTVAALAAETAAAWREGLATWDQDGERIARLQSAVDIRLYTPGGTAGAPLTVLKSFAAPSAAVAADADALRERLLGAASGLLALAGIEADPLQSREHVLVSNIIERAWNAGKDLDLAELLRDIQKPPFDKVGMLDVESFFPSRERFELAMRLNNLLASPAFAAWREGEPLDIGRLLYTAEGRPRLSIISIAHLGDAERMFFVTMLLNEVVGWMRSQPGTSSLRAILYMDEVFGYFPPSANPPAKTPMLTLLKQARAFGLGVVLATQNPVDLDYKGLSNAGIWFLGRLQTERDKARVLDGLEGASAAAGETFDRRRLDELLSSLGKRVFLMKNVHEDEPRLMQTRWTLSYLRGPLTREQMRLLAKETTAAAPALPSTSAPVPSQTPMGDRQAGDRPVLPPGIDEVFIASDAAGTMYLPAIYAKARVHFVNAKAGVDEWQTIFRLAPVEGLESATSAWDAPDLPGEPWKLADGPPTDARYAELPPSLATAKTYAQLATSLKAYLHRERSLRQYRCPPLKLGSQPGESEAAFRARVALAVRERRDAQIETLKSKYAAKFAAAEERVRKAEQREEKERSQASSQTFQAAVSVGETLLGALFGRRRSNVSRVATSARAASRVMRERSDIAQAEETVAAARQRLQDLDEEFQAAVAALEELSPADALVEPIEIAPRKADIAIERVALAWVRINGPAG